MSILLENRRAIEGIRFDRRRASIPGQFFGSRSRNWASERTVDSDRPTSRWLSNKAVNGVMRFSCRFRKIGKQVTEGEMFFLFFCFSYPTWNDLKREINRWNLQISCQLGMYKIYVNCQAWGP